MSQFVRYQGRPGELSPTAAASQFYADLVSVYGAKNVINFGQGAETENPPDSLMVTAEAANSVAYRKQVGGEETLRIIAAEWAATFLGIHATKDNTFVTQQQGREGIREAVTYASTKNDGTRASLPLWRWPMYDAIVKRVRGAAINSYQNPIGENLDERQMQSFEKDIVARDASFVVITNTPENPRGSIYSTAYMRNLGERLDGINDWLGPQDLFPVDRIFHVIDIPYFYAGPQNSSTHRFNAGYEHVTKPDAETPWIAVISFSKALGTATPGLTFTVTHPAIAKDFRNQLTHGGGLSYSEGFFHRVAHVFDPSNYEEQSRHYAHLREKYRINRDVFTQRFGQAVVAGDPGMTLLMREATLVGQTLKKGGHKYELKTTPDIVEYIGNTQRLVVVDNGQEGSDALIRNALALRPDKFPAGVDKLSAAIAHAQHG